MPAKISELIQKLKREVPELENNPLLDEIEMAAHEGGDEAADAAAGMDEGSPEDEKMDYDAMLPPDDAEGDEAPAPAPKKKAPPFRK